MATAKKAPEPGPEPSAHEIVTAIAAWQLTRDTLNDVRQREEDARRHLVDVLHRAGLTGFSL